MRETQAPGAGETLARRSAGTTQTVRLHAGAGAAGGGAPAPLAAAALGDGPWCPSPAAPVRWDADLARIDAVRVVISIAVAVDTLRPAAALGLARRPGARLVPDLVLDTTVRAGRRSGGL